jgi:hypothetical protein
MGIVIAIIIMAGLVTWRLRPAQAPRPSSSSTNDLPPDVRRDLHADAVRLNRQQLWFALVGVILVAVAVPTAYILGTFRGNFYRLGRTLIAAGAVLVWAVSTGLEWLRLRQLDPSQYE